MKKFILPATFLVSLVVFFPSCKKVIYDIECDDVTLCLKNGGTDTIHFTFYGGTSSMPVFDQSVAPGDTVCHGYGYFRYYYAEKLNDQYEEHLEGTNAAVIETSNMDYYDELYYFPFEQCRQTETILE